MGSGVEPVGFVELLVFPRLTAVPVPVGVESVVLIARASAPPPPASITAFGVVTVPAGIPRLNDDVPMVLAGALRVGNRVLVEATTSYHLPSAFGAAPARRIPPAVSRVSP